MAAVPLTGAFKPAIPTTFAGNRAESEQFLREFRQFRRNNRDHASILSPYLRVGLACSFIRGPIVNDWVDIMERTLDADTTRTANPIAETDEVLWTNFEASFKSAWTDTLSKQNAYQQLTTLVRSGDNIDEYIATFERLALVAGWHRDASGTVEVFRKGLTHTLLRACLLRTTMPETMTEWQTAARAEAQRARTLASCLPPRKDGPRRPQPTFYTHAAPAPVPVLAPTIPDGVVPMDVDAATTNTPRYNPRYAAPLSDAERERCMREGRCFRCQQLGHTAFDCPQKLRRPSTRPPPAHANATSSAPLPPAAPSAQPASINTATALHHISGLSERARQDAIHSLVMMGGSDLGDGDTPQINALELSLTPFTAAFDTPPPRPPRSPRRSSSPRITSPPLPVVADDDTLERGVKTSPTASILPLPSPVDDPPRQNSPPTPHKLILPAPTNDEPPQTTPPSEEKDDFDFEEFYLSYINDNGLTHADDRHADIFPHHALEMPRDPDEVAPHARHRRRHHVKPPTLPQTPTMPLPAEQRNRANAASTAPTQPIAPVTARNRDRHDLTTARANDRIHDWLAQIAYEPPPRIDSRPTRPRPPIDPIAEERADYALRDYGYEYEDARTKN
ncbi:hypothetical protein EDB83DRAFT_27286 [Lactarius deliciosus]|nr:hypothetical protein EDB83DRAFT_27286 [Lactarius deliciosus]